MGGAEEERLGHSGLEPQNGAYGEAFAERFGVEAALAIESKVAVDEVFAVTRVTSPTAMIEPTPAFPIRQALVVSVALCDVPHRNYEFWVDGKFRDVPHLRPLTTSVTDMESSPVCRVTVPFDYLHFYVPRAALAEVAIDLGVAQVQHFRCCLAEHDPVLSQIARLVTSSHKLSAIENDRFGLIVAAHLIGHYSGCEQSPRRSRSGLAVWQKKAAIDFLDSHLHSDLRLSDVASVCGLSASHFARAFKISYGKNVTQYISDRRLERAKELLAHARVPLLEVAYRIGFRGQPGFTRWFSGRVGTSPGSFRRQSPNVR